MVVVVAEQMGSDGKPWLRVCSDEDATPWGRLGLLEYAVATQQARVAADEP